MGYFINQTVDMRLSDILIQVGPKTKKVCQQAAIVFKQEADWYRGGVRN